MNETIRLLKKRQSVRRFANRPISESEKREILNAAFEAPTAGALQLYSIIDVQDPERKAFLAKSCDQQPFIATAPLVLLFLADYQRWIDLFNADPIDELPADRAQRLPGEGDFLLAAMDALIAAQNTVIAAESLGIGSCYIGDIIENYENVRQVFNLPRYAAPIALLVYGYPTDRQKEIPKPKRIASDALVYRDKYRRLPKEELLHLYEDEPILTSGPFAGLSYPQRFYLRKFCADFSIEMTRSAREILAQWRSDGKESDQS